MTREHKLALLIGFGLVLLVGILVADHFSSARRALVNADLDAGSPERFGSPGGGPMSVASQMPPPTFGAPAIATDPLPPAETWAAGEPAPPALVWTMGERPQLSRDPLEGSDLSLQAGRSGFSNLGLDRAPYAAEVDRRIAEPAATRTSTVQDVPVRTMAAANLPVSRGRLLRHEVVRGDNLIKLSEKYYQEGNLWRKLQEYNADRVGADGAVRTGVTLLIPPRDVLLGQAALGPETRASSAPPPAAAPESRPQAEPAKAAPKSEPARPAAPSPRTYVVKSGDTLGKIAQQQLGTSTRWREIRELNKKVLEDADTIYVGMTLALPSR